MPKRILIFSLAYYPNNVSGAEVAIKEITDRIEPGEIEFHMVTLRFGNELRKEKVGNVFVHRVGFGSVYISKILFVPLAALAARRLHARQLFNAVWVVMTYMLFPAMAARTLGLQAPLVLTLQDGDPYEKVFERWYVRPFTPLLDWGFRTAVVVQTISTYLATWPRRRGYRGIVEVIPNGASLQSAQEYPVQELDALKKSVDKKEGDVFLVTVARLVHQKGQDDVIRALPVLPESVHYLIVGDGADRDMLEALAAELGVRERVVFTGQVDRTMTAKYRKISDIFVSPSRSEGQGIAFLSTMVSGLPMIATQEGGLADFIFDAKRNPDKPTTGWAVDKDSSEQIAAAVKDILAHPHETQRVVETAKKFARDNFDWDIIAKAMQDKVFWRVLK